MHMRGWVLVLTAALASSADAVRFEVLESDDAHVRVAFTLGPLVVAPTEVAGGAFVQVAPDIPGRVGEEGAPDVPSVGRLIGIPPDAVPALAILEVETSTRRGRALPVPSQRILPPSDPEGLATPALEHAATHRAYTSGVFPAEWAALGDVGRLRNQSVVPLRFTPVRQRGDGVLEVAERIVVDIRFAPPPDGGARRWVRSREDAPDRALYEHLVLNAVDAARWRVREALPVHPSLRRGRYGMSEAIKITVREDGLRRVNYGTLAAAGWPSGVPIADLVLETRGYDASALDVGGDPFVRTPIGIHVVDANTNGTFDGSDHFFFFGENSKSHRGWTPPRDRYTWDNVYWLTHEPGAGTLMSTRSGALTGGPVSEPSDYAHTERYEENRHYRNYSFNEDDHVALRQTSDHMLMTTGVFGPTLAHREPFDVWTPAAGTSLDVSAEFQNGAWQTTSTFGIGIAIGVGGTPRPTPGLLVAQPNSRRPYAATLDATYIGEGPHEFVFTMQTEGSQILLNWFQIGYRRRFVADAGRLRFTNGDSTGRVRWTVSAFANPNLLVVDVTDKASPVRITDASVTQNGSTYDLQFEADVTGDVDYVAMETAWIPAVSAGDVVLDMPSDIADVSPGNAALDADILCVVYDAFYDAMLPWVAHRESQGHVVDLVRVQDVYDEFGGGVFGPEAIREYVRYAYRVRPSVGGEAPKYLLLVGDASESYWGIGTDPAPNFVPTSMVIGRITDQGSTSRPFIASDQWFIQDPGGDGVGGDYFTSMMVGRLSTESLAETQVVVDKIIQYERRFQNDPDSQSWRRRGLFFADDAYSGDGVGVGVGSYGFVPSERAFVSTCLAAMDTIRAAGYADFGLERFFLSEALDSVPALGRSVSPPTCNWPCTRRTVRNILDTDATLIDRLNRGHLFVTYQGHGNRNLVTHEYVLVGNGNIGGPPGVPDGVVYDADRLGNVGKPAIWFFNACHVAEFAKQNENSASPQFVGDCLAERLLFRPDAGAIAAVASTGFELLTHVDPINRITFSSWFSRPEAADPYSGEPRLLLGEIMLGAKNLLVAQSSAYEGIVESYVTLGDPTLRVDIAPPRFKVWQDRGDRPWEDDAAPEPFSSGARIRASDPDRDDALFAARIFDEVPIASDSIAIGVREGGVTSWVDPADYTLTPGDPDPEFGLVRSYELHYTAPLTPSDFDLVFRAVDANDRRMDLVLEARTSVRFYEVDDAGGQRELVAGSFVDATRGRVRARVETPVAIPADDLSFSINDVPVTAVDVTPASKERGGSGRAFVWFLDATIPTELFSEGANTIRVAWGGGQPGQSASIQLSSIAAFTVDRVFAYPNPFERTTGIFYRASVAARSARVKIYTITGRLIRVLEQAVPRPDLNEIEWDGRDQDGDAVANGVYFYRLELDSAEGGRSVEQGKIARVAGHSPRTP